MVNDKWGFMRGLISLLINALLQVLNLPLAQAQTCLHTKLSNQYNFETKIKWLRHPDYYDTAFITVRIIDKDNNKVVQKIHFQAGYLLSNEFVDCKSERSYTTKWQTKGQIVDNDYGDLVVADLNFDSLEDLAIKFRSGGNNSPKYAFYIQNKQGHFVRDSFLTNKMWYFPEKIIKSKRTLVTCVPVNARKMAVHTYRLSAKTNWWKRISHWLEGRR